MFDSPNPPLLEGPPGPLTRIDGRQYLYFGGTSYLGLQAREEVIEAACAALRQYGVGTATSRTGYGNSPLVTEVESRVVEFFGTDTAFYFPSAFAGSHILVQALAERADVVFIDEAAHFSLQEASRLAGVPIVCFRHSNAGDLREKLKSHVAAEQRPLVLTDGVFSLTGEISPLDRYSDVLRDYKTATLLVDDAHGFGAIGNSGRGTLDHLGLWREGINGDPAAKGLGIFVCGTLSKAFGGYGGIIPSNAALLARIRQTSHYYEGASPPMSAAAAASAKAIEIAMREPQLRGQLRDNVRRVRGGLCSLGLHVDDLPAPIIGLSLGTADNMRRIHDELQKTGIIVPYFADYAGSGAAGRLRIAVFTTHTDEMLDRLVGEIGKLA